MTIVLLYILFSTQGVFFPKTLIALAFLPYFLLRSDKKISSVGQVQGTLGTVSWGIFVLLLVYLIISSFRTPYQYFTIDNVSILWASFLTFGLAIKYRSNLDTTDRFMKIFVYAMTFASLYAIAEFMGYIPDTTYRFFPLEVTGHVGHKNTYGFMTMCAIAFALYFLNKKVSALTVATSVILILGMIISDSRTSLVLTFLLAFVMIAAFIRERKTMGAKDLKRYMFIVIIIAISFVTVGTIIAGPRIKQRLAALTNVENHSFRGTFWTAQVNMFKSSPLWGTGLGSFPELNNTFVSDSYKRSSGGELHARRGHNEYLERFSELGLVGGSLYFYFWIGALILAIREIRRAKTIRSTMIGSIMIMMMLHAIVSTPSVKPMSGFLLWGFIGYYWAPVLGSRAFHKNRWTMIATAGISLFVLGLFTRNLVSEFYYRKAIKQDSRISLLADYDYLDKAISIFPEHVYAAYALIENEMKSEEYESVIAECHRVENFSPYVLKLNFYRGASFARLGYLDSAVIYLNKELDLREKQTNSVEYLALICSQTGNDAALKSLKDVNLDSSWVGREDFTVNQREDYRKRVGEFRYYFGGPFLKKDYKVYLSKREASHNEKRRYNEFLYNL